MKIRQTKTGDWTMEHNGVEAPYDVVRHTPDKWSVFDIDDEDGDHPIADLEDIETCERLALAHFNK